jgi:hypothetical protein
MAMLSGQSVIVNVQLASNLQGFSVGALQPKHMCMRIAPRVSLRASDQVRMNWASFCRPFHNVAPPALRPTRSWTRVGSAFAYARGCYVTCTLIEDVQEMRITVDPAIMRSKACSRGIRITLGHDCRIHRRGSGVSPPSIPGPRLRLEAPLVSPNVRVVANSSGVCTRKQTFRGRAAPSRTNSSRRNRQPCLEALKRGAKPQYIQFTNPMSVAARCYRHIQALRRNPS